MKKKFKRIVAMLLCTTMTTSIASDVFAGIGTEDTLSETNGVIDKSDLVESGSGIGIVGTDAELPDDVALAIESGDYVLLNPSSISSEQLDGNAYYIGAGEIKLSEKSDKKYLVKIGRCGDVSQKGSVDLKFTDISAKLGTNYNVEIFGKENSELTVDDNHISYAEQFANSDNIQETPVLTDTDKQKEILGEIFSEETAQEAKNITSSSVDNGIYSQNPLAIAKSNYTGNATDRVPLNKKQQNDKPYVPNVEETTKESSIEETSAEQTTSILENPEELSKIVENPESAGVNKDEADQYKKMLENGELDIDEVQSTLKLNFESGESEQYIVISPKYSRENDGDGYFFMELKNPQNGLIAESLGTNMGIIVDENSSSTPKVSIADKNIVAEGDYANVEITREGRLNDTVYVQLWSKEDTAITGQDFSQVNTKVVFPMGVKSRNIQIPLNHIEDEDVEFSLHISDPAGCEIKNDSANVTITSADKYDEAQSEFTSEDVSENANVEETTTNDNTGYTTETIETTTNTKSDEKSDEKYEICIDEAAVLDSTLASGLVMLANDGVALFSASDDRYDNSLNLNNAYKNHAVMSSDGSYLNVKTKGYDFGSGKFDSKAVWNLPKGYYSGVKVTYSYAKTSAWWSTYSELGIIGESGNKAIIEGSIYYDYYHNNNHNINKTTARLLFSNPQTQPATGVRAWLSSGLYDGSGVGGELKIYDVTPIKRKFNISLKEADTLSFKNTSEADARAYCSAQIAGGSNGTSGRYYSGDSITVRATSAKNYAKLSKLWLITNSGKVLLGTNKGDSNSITVSLNTKLIENIAGKLEYNSKDDYSAKFVIQPEFDYYDAEVRIVSSDYGKFENYTITGKDQFLTGYHLGDKIVLNSIVNDKYVSNYRGTGFEWGYRANEAKELVTGTQNYGYNGKTELVLDNQYNEFKPLFTAVENTIKVSVSRNLVDSGKFDTSKGIFLADRNYNSSTNCYEYSVVPNGELRVNNIYTLTAIPKDSANTVQWEESENSKVYSGNIFWHNADARITKNDITLSLKENVPKKDYTISGKLYNSNINLLTQRSNNNEAFVPAVGANFIFADGTVQSDKDGAFETEKFSSIPNTYMRYMIVDNGNMKIADMYLSNETNKDMGVITVPTQSYTTASVQSVYVEQNGQYVAPTIPLSGAKTNFIAVVNDGNDYTFDNQTYKENITGVKFVVVDSQTKIIKGTYPAKKSTVEGQENVWVATIPSLTPENPTQYTFGDNLYVQFTSDKKVAKIENTDTNETSYVTAAYDIIASGLQFASDTNYTEEYSELNLPLDADSMFAKAEASSTDAISLLSSDTANTKAKKKKFATLPLIGGLDFQLSSMVMSKSNINTSADYYNGGSDAEDLNGSMGENSKANNFAMSTSLSITIENRPNGSIRLKVGLGFSTGNENARTMSDYKNTNSLSFDDLWHTSSQKVAGVVQKPKNALGSYMNRLNNTFGGAQITFNVGVGSYFDFGIVVDEDQGILDANANSLVLLGFGGYISFSGTFNYTWYFVIPLVVAYVPAFAGIKISAYVGANVGAERNPNYVLDYNKFGTEEANFDEALRFNYDLSGMIMFQGYLGVGIADILAIRGTGTFGFILMYDELVKTYYNNQVNPLGFRISFMLGAQVDFFWASIPFTVANWDLYKYGMFNDLDKYYQDNPDATSLLSLNGLDLEGSDVSTQIKLHERAKGGTWTGGADTPALMSTFTPSNEYVLSRNGYDSPNTQLLNMGNGRIFMAFLDDDGTKADNEITTLKYSVFDGGMWSDPVTVQNDSTGDFYPNLCDAGDSVMISWVSTDPNKSNSETQVGSYMQTEVYTTLYNKATGKIGNIDKLTDDNYMDSNPVGVYDNETGDRTIYYTKTSMNTNEDNPEYLIDVNGSKTYSVITYRLYDKASDSWLTTYFPNEYDGETPSAEWNGQRFLDTEVTYKNADGLETKYDPIITDFKAAPGYNGLAVFTYTIDLDNDSSTNEDKEVYMQIYDFRTHKTFHPIRVTSNSYSDMAPQLVRTKDKTYLFWESNEDKIRYVNVTDLVKFGINDDGTLKDNNSIQDTTLGNTFYNTDTAINEVSLANEDIDNDKGNVDTYKACVDNEGNMYIIWAETVKDEETDKYSREVFATAMINDENGGSWSTPNQLTNSGKVNDNIAVATDDNGNLVIVNTRYNMTRTNDENNPISIDNVELVATNLVPEGSVEVTYMEYDNRAPLAGNKVHFSAYIKNTGLTTANGYDVNFYEYNADGTKGNLIASTSSNEPMLANGGETFEFDWNVPDDISKLNGMKVVAEASEKGYPNVDSFYTETMLTTPYYYVTLKDIYQDGNDFYAKYSVKNTGNAVANENDKAIVAFNREYTDASSYGITDTNFAIEDLTGLAPDETKEFVSKLNIPATAFDKYGYIGCNLAVYNVHQNEYNETVYDMYSNIQDKWAVQAGPLNLVVNDGKDISINTGDSVELNATFEGKKYSKYANISYTVDDDSVAQIVDGKLVGIKNGTTNLKATITPYGNTDEIKISVSGEVTTEVTTKVSNSSGGGGRVKYNATTTTTETTTQAAEPTTIDNNVEPTTENTTILFDDVKASDWFSNAVYEARDMGVVYGMTDKLFEPNTNVTRGMFVAMLARFAKANLNNTSNKFNDVTEGSYYAGAVAWGTENGIIFGYDDETFAPNDTITREQAVAMLMRYAEYMGEGSSEWKETNILSYKDFDNISEWAIPAIQWSCGAGVIKGRTDETVNPLDNLTRAETAQLIINYNNNVSNFVQK